jgi:very-short-patch-repair endonuclease
MPNGASGWRCATAGSEADGGQHADNEADRRRTAWLESEGWRVLRFWNNNILANTSGVVETILKELQEK